MAELYELTWQQAHEKKGNWLEIEHALSAIEADPELSLCFSKEAVNQALRTIASDSEAGTWFADGPKSSFPFWLWYKVKLYHVYACSDVEVAFVSLCVL